MSIPDKFMSYRRLLRDDNIIIIEHVHDKLVQAAHVLLVRPLLLAQLVVDVGEELVVLVVLGDLLRDLHVLRRHDGCLCGWPVDLLVEEDIQLVTGHSIS